MRGTVALLVAAVVLCAYATSCEGEHRPYPFLDGVKPSDASTPASALDGLATTCAPDVLDGCSPAQPAMPGRLECTGDGGCGDLPIDLGSAGNGLAMPTMPVAATAGIRDGGVDSGMDGSVSMEPTMRPVVPAQAGRVLTERMLVEVGGASYLQQCDAPSPLYISGNLDSTGATGPGMTATSVTTPFGCEPWPSTNPALSLQVWFRGFLPSEGIPEAEYDLSDSTLPEHLLIDFYLSSQAEVAAGAQTPYAEYRSYALMYDSSTAVTTYEQLPTVSGSVSVVAVEGVNEAIYSFSRSVTFVGFREITLRNVVLTQISGAMADLFPKTITVKEALMYW